MHDVPSRAGITISNGNTFPDARTLVTWTASPRVRRGVRHLRDRAGPCRPRRSQPGTHRISIRSPTLLVSRIVGYLRGIELYLVPGDVGVDRLEDMVPAPRDQGCIEALQGLDQRLGVLDQRVGRGGLDTQSQVLEAIQTWRHAAVGRTRRDQLRATSGCCAGASDRTPAGANGSPSIPRAARCGRCSRFDARRAGPPGRQQSPCRVGPSW